MTKRRFTIGMRCRIKKNSDFDLYQGHEVLLTERSGRSFAAMVLGQSELKKKDSKTVVNQVAWIPEKDLELVDADFEKNLDFIDWYQAHDDDFCPDCGAWFPDYWRMGEDKNLRCPGKDCPANLIADGFCPFCGEKFNKDGECEECDYEFRL